MCFITEAPAKAKPHPEGDPRIVAKSFGDTVHMDTLFLTRGKEGKLEESDAPGEHTKAGLTFKDEKTKDIEFIPIQDRSSREAKRAIIQFGGPKGSIKKCVSDNAPEFRKALVDLDIAPLEATPGRSTSHGTAERANRQVLECGRPALAQSGLSLDFGARACKFAFMSRRLHKITDTGKSIYEEKHPGAKVPPEWAFGAAVTFKPTKDTKNIDDAKVLPRGRPGVLLGYHTSPGGAWSGDYEVADLDHFKTLSGRKRIRIYRTKTVS